MNLEYNTFLKLLNSEDKESVSRFALDLIKKEKIGIVSLYEDYLAPSLNDLHCEEEDETCIWKEHVRSAIVRSIMEMMYPFLLEEITQSGVDKVQKRVLVVCPEEEYHEMGARMAHDYFLLSGFDSIYIGANTPTKVVLSAIRVTKPDYLAISVTNYYNLVAAKKMVDAAKTLKPNLTILGGGYGFSLTDADKTVGIDYRLTTYASIQRLKEVK